MNFNLNDSVIVRLTDYGVRVLLDCEEKEMGDILSHVVAGVTPRFSQLGTVHERYHVGGNEWRFQFHRFMEVFGSYLGSGKREVLMDYNVRVEGGDAPVEKEPDYNGGAAWEKMMMELLGRDGLGSVCEAITYLKEQNKIFLEEIRSIRKHIGANDEGSTYDEVVRLTLLKSEVPKLDSVYLVRSVESGMIHGAFREQEGAIAYTNGVKNGTLSVTNIDVV